jgi:hypothetical protein
MGFLFAGNPAYHTIDRRAMAIQAAAHGFGRELIEGVLSLELDPGTERLSTRVNYCSP